MRIEFKRTPEKVELVRAMGSQDKEKARQAMEAFAAFIGPVVQKVLNTAATSALFYKDVEYDEDDSPSFPLDLFFGKIDNFVQVWFQNVAGGVPSSQVMGLEQLKFGTYNLTSAVHWLDKFARKARLDVIAMATNRLVQEILVKQERNAWGVALKGLAEATTNGNAHVIDATTDGTFQLDDLNRMLTRSRRVWLSFNNGTPDGAEGKGINELFVSPEVMEQIRGFAYQPMSTRTVPSGGSNTPGLALPDSIREEIFRNAGDLTIYDIGITELNEFGTSQKYNTLFDNFYTGSITFATANEEIVVGVRTTSGAFVRPIAINANGGQVTVQPDDQFLTRSGKSGVWASLDEGRVLLDARNILGCVV